MRECSAPGGQGTHGLLVVDWVRMSPEEERGKGCVALPSESLQQ